MRHWLSRNRSSGVTLRYRQRPWRSSPSCGLPGLRPVLPRWWQSDAIGTRTMPRVPDLLLASGMTGLTRGARRSLCGHALGCSTRAFAATDRRVIESHSVRLSANFLRPERRSTDGQMILKRTSGPSETRPDLLFCGAPLRNRTVDLLLTMDHQTVPVSAVEALSRQNASSPQRGRAQISPHRLRFAPQMPLVMIYGWPPTGKASACERSFGPHSMWHETCTCR